MEFFNQLIDNVIAASACSWCSMPISRMSVQPKPSNILQKADSTFNFPVEWGSDLQTEHERYLTEKIFKRPVFVTDYPKDIKAFYMRLNDDGRTVAAMDLLVPEVGEIIGGSQREERLDVLQAAHRGNGSENRGLRVVPGLPPLWRHSPCRFRARF